MTRPSKSSYPHRHCRRTGRATCMWRIRRAKRIFFGHIRSGGRLSVLKMMMGRTKILLAAVGCSALLTLDARPSESALSLRVLYIGHRPSEFESLLKGHSREFPAAVSEGFRCRAAGLAAKRLRTPAASRHLAAGQTRRMGQAHRVAGQCRTESRRRLEGLRRLRVNVPCACRLRVKRPPDIQDATAH